MAGQGLAAAPASATCSSPDLRAWPGLSPQLRDTILRYEEQAGLESSKDTLDRLAVQLQQQQAPQPPAQPAGQAQGQQNATAALAADTAASPDAAVADGGRSQEPGSGDSKAEL